MIPLGIREEYSAMEARARKRLKAVEKTHLAMTLDRLDEKCRNCHPLTPMECVEGCEVWTFKRELRHLHRIITQENYLNMLLNTLKNSRRLEILELLSRNYQTTAQIQQELKKHGFVHSQKTIIEEYIEPLVTAGLVASNSSCYRTTVFGKEINQLLANYELGNVLSPHSECHEEEVVKILSESPRTYEELEFLARIKSLPRVLERLLKANLVTKENENNYIYYFKTKRSLDMEKPSSTAKRVHENIPEEGITAEELAEKAKISLRRIYKYLRKLRGKKLAFKRKRPKTYSLTTEGLRIASTLEKMHMLLKDFSDVSADVTKSFEALQPIPAESTRRDAPEKPLQILVESGSSHKIY